MTAYDWSGATDGDVTVATNYTPNGNPIASDVVTIPNPVTTAPTTGTSPADWVINDRIDGGTFNGAITNNGAINGGTFNGAVTTSASITGGTFTGVVTCQGTTITGGTFSGELVTSGIYSDTITWATISGKATFWATTTSDCTFTGELILSDLFNLNYQGGNMAGLKYLTVDTSPRFSLYKGINGSAILGMI